MPYIPFDQRREAIDQYRSGLGIQEPGELAYIIADALDSFTGSQYDFKRLSEALGALDSARAEFYATVVAPYEATKRKQNGTAFILSGGDPL